ncbi:PREDICTED: DNA topoisomerase 3-beta-1 isoform X2 [Nicrophorus vespilloides]|uniref:DNA topoisomerase n=1 Tax=Nicrophorus vespilloides TaxID=110193 RepID=A0ABM1MVI6_NICVS|nr:PREDICTED: DNA topoisomerase 3-beta-1 isoform X2 [Nicrophorus vespilloides]
MRTILMVAEKPSLASSLAQILSNNKNTSRKGLNGSCSVHEWIGTFKSSQAKFKMTSVCGHVMSLDFNSKYNNWDRVDPVELFMCPTEKKEATPKLKMPYFLSQEAKGCDTLVLWLDCDKEGENICFEVMNAVANSINVYSNNVTYRAKFSAITEKDIKAAFNNLGVPNENEAKSVDARQELDLRIGCAFTRYQTKYFQGKYGDLDASLISYGPCQTPTLGFCVQRHDQIQTFKSEPYWIVQVNVKTSDGQDINLDWQRVRSFDKEVANLFLNICKSEKTAKVLSVISKEKSKVRPVALNTVELMRVASSGLGMSPHHAMQIAEKLYIQGYISYPRTETTKYPENFDLMSVLKQQQNSSEWGTEVSEILANGMNRPKSGHDAGDHPPITPMKLASRHELDADSWKLYDYIARHFIGTVSKDCKYMSTTSTFDVNGETFSVTGKSLIDPGYTKIMTWQAFGKNEIVPNFKTNENVAITDCKLTEHQTCPPDYLTESELITLMEKHGIGTDASIPVHINNICQRNYVNVTGGRKLVPTTLGIVLVHGYQKIDAQLVLPTMRSAVEEQLNLIALGRADFQAVLKHTVDIFKLKFQYFVKNIDGMDQLFEVSFSPLSASGRAFSRCGKCRRYLKFIQAKPQRLHCPQCDETYSLPQNGKVNLYKELKCPLDDFELLSWSMGNKGKSFPFCPYCYNNSPFRDMKKGSGCNACTHPTCPHGLNANGICSCIECEFGVLVLDPSSSPKWKLGCNKCDIIIHLFEDAQKIMIDDEVCECGTQLVTVKYVAEKSKFPNQAMEMSGCIFCLPEFNKLVDKHKAIASRPKGRIFRGGKAGGRGRGGRGRGRQPKDKMAQLAAYFV